MSEVSVCNLCGEPMPTGEEMFKYHGYSGPCPKEPLPRANAGHPDPQKKERDWRTMSVTEIAAENQSVAEYIAQLEGERHAS